MHLAGGAFRELFDTLADATRRREMDSLRTLLFKEARAAGVDLQFEELRIHRPAEVDPPYPAQETSQGR